MATLFNTDHNIIFEINFDPPSKDFSDFLKSDLDEWIIFNLKFTSPFRKISIKSSNRAMLSAFEVNHLLKTIELSLRKKSNEIFHFCCIERYFDFDIEFLEVDDIFEFTIYFNLGAVTNGEIYGFDEIYRFNLSIDTLEKFHKDLSNFFNLTHI
jgi:hypothetical protein